MDELRHLHLRTNGAPIRTVTHNGREHLVIPVIALREGVIHAVNAETPEYVSASRLQAAAASWNGRPLVLGHPVRDGRQISANEPGVLEAQGFGTIFKSATRGINLGMEAWVDPARLEAMGEQQLLADLRAGKQIEVSVGAFVKTLNKTGTHQGKSYMAEWGDITGDHLAFLPRAKGACSIEMGCGAHRAAEAAPIIHEFKDDEPMAKEVKSLRERVVEMIRAARDIPQSKRDEMKDSDFAGPGTSFPIAKPEDVAAAASAMGRAKNPDAVKAKIIVIAKRKGAEFEAQLPKAWRTASVYDSPQQAASEEAAELVSYQTMREAADAVGNQWDTLSGIIDDLVSDEEDDPTETPQEEQAEEEVEQARMESIIQLANLMCSSLQAISSLCYKELQPEPIQPSDPRYMEGRALIGKKISAATMKSIQGMHDASHSAHDHAMGLGADCAGPMKAAKAKMMDCPTCDGDGQMDGKDCATCDGTGQVAMKAAQENHGAGTSDHNGEHVPATIANKGEETMTKDMRAGIIKALAACKCSGFEGAAAELETLSDARLESLQASSAAREKAEADFKAASEKPKELTEDEALAKLPRLKALVDGIAAQEAARKAELIGVLKTAQTAYTEEELKGLDVNVLEKLTMIAKVPMQPNANFAGRPMPVAPRTAEENDVYSNPPDPWSKDALKAAEARRVN